MLGESGQTLSTVALSQQHTKGDSLESGIITTWNTQFALGKSRDCVKHETGPTNTILILHKGIIFYTLELEGLRPDPLCKIKKRSKLHALPVNSAPTIQYYNSHYALQQQFETCALTHFLMLPVIH